MSQTLTIDQRIEVPRRFMAEVFNGQNPEGARDFFTADALWHGPSIAEVAGVDSIVGLLGAFIGALSDINAEEQDVIASGDLVAAGRHRHPGRRPARDPVQRTRRPVGRGRHLPGHRRQQDQRAVGVRRHGGDRQPARGLLPPLGELTTSNEGANDEHLRHDNSGNVRTGRRPTRLRARAEVVLRPCSQRAGLLRRTRRAEPLLGHGRRLPSGVPDHAGRRRPLRRTAEHRAQPPAGYRRDRASQRREQQGDLPGPHPPPRGPRGRILALRQGRHADRARGDPAAPASGRRPGPDRHRRRPSATAGPWRSAASVSSSHGTAPTTLRTTASSTFPSTTR